MATPGCVLCPDRFAQTYSAGDEQRGDCKCNDPLVVVIEVLDGPKHKRDGRDEEKDHPSGIRMPRFDSDATALPFGGENLSPKRYGPLNFPFGNSVAWVFRLLSGYFEWALGRRRRRIRSCRRDGFRSRKAWGRRQGHNWMDGACV